MIDLPPTSLLYSDDLIRVRRDRVDQVFSDLVDTFNPDNVPTLEFPERSLGFEIEVVHDSCMVDSNIEKVFRLLMDKLGLEHCVGKDESYQKWALTWDMTVSSPPDFKGLSNESRGIEVVSPVLRTQQEKMDYVRVMAGLRHLGFYASRECGSHVWFGLPEFQAQMDGLNVAGASDFVESVGQCGPILKKALGPHLRPSRHTTFFSGIPKTGNNWSWINLGEGQAMGERGKESMINMQHLVLRGALEFRAMGHTMDPVEIHKGLLVLEKCLSDITKSKPKRLEPAEFLIRNMGTTRGPLGIEETRQFLLQARWSNSSISVARHEDGVRPEFFDGDDFLFTDEALATGLREFVAPKEHTIAAYAKSIFSDHVYMNEQSPEVVKATNLLDNADRDILLTFFENQPKNDGDAVDNWRKRCANPTPIDENCPSL